MFPHNQRAGPASGMPQPATQTPSVAESLLKANEQIDGSLRLSAELIDRLRTGPMPGDGAPSPPGPSGLNDTAYALSEKSNTLYHQLAVLKQLICG